MGDTEDDLEGEEQGEKERVERSEVPADKSVKAYAVMSLIKNFSDFTHTPWDSVWDKTIIEVLNVMAFAKEYNRRQEQAIKRYRRTH